MGTAVFILETTVIALSLLAGLGRVGGPAMARIALAFFALFIIPGASLDRLVFRTPARALEKVCRVFCFGLVFSSLVVCAGFIPGVSYTVISLIASGLAIALAFFARVRGRPETALDSFSSGGPAASRAAGVRSAVIVAALFILCVLAFSGMGELGWSTDSLDHVSFVRRSVDSGSLFPRDSYYREGDGVSLDPRKGLWHPVLSLWTYQSHEQADRVWREIPAFVAFFAISSFLLLAVELCGSTLVAALALAFFLALYGGGGIEWLGKLGFSRNVAQVTFWADCALLIAYYRTRSGRYLFVASLIACVGAAYHVVFALLLGSTLVGLFCAVTFLASVAGWRGAFWRSVPALAAGIAIPLAVRARDAGVPANMIHTHMQGMLVFGRNLATVDPAELATRYGLVFFFVLLMTPFFFLVARRTERRGLVFLLFLVPAILVLDPLIASFMERRIAYLYYRILDAAPLLVMLALIIAGLSEMILFGRTRPGRGAMEPPLAASRGVANRLFAALCLALFVLFPVRASMAPLGTALRGLVERREAAPPAYRDLFNALSERIPDHSVIISDPLTSYVISAYTDHFVGVTLDQHCSPTDTGAVGRLREARNLMSPAAALDESRPWLVRERADYVLVNLNLGAHEDFFDSVQPGGARGAYEKFLACPSLLTEVLAVDGFRLFRVRADSLEAPWEAHGCAVARALPLSCEGNEGGAGRVEEGKWDRLVVGSGIDVGCGIVLVSCTVDNYMLVPGDTLTGHFCWMASDNVPFGLPLETAVRIDTEFPKKAWYRDGYGKQYRRILERRTKRFYRLTWQSRLGSGFSYPDMWGARRVVRQDFSFPLSPWLAGGAYEVRVKVCRVPYLANRRLSDYFSNDDSLEGVPVGMIYVQERFGEAVPREASERTLANPGGRAE